MGRKCSTCRKPVKNHDGPTGKRCGTQQDKAEPRVGSRKSPQPAPVTGAENQQASAHDVVRESGAVPRVSPQSWLLSGLDGWVSASAVGDDGSAPTVTVSVPERDGQRYTVPSLLDRGPVDACAPTDGGAAMSAAGRAANPRDQCDVLPGPGAGQNDLLGGDVLPRLDLTQSQDRGIPGERFQNWQENSLFDFENRPRVRGPDCGEAMWIPPTSYDPDKHSRDSSSVPYSEYKQLVDHVNNMSKSISALQSVCRASMRPGPRPMSCGHEYAMVQNGGSIEASRGPISSLGSMGGGVSSLMTGNAQPRGDYKPGTMQYKLRSQGVSVKTIETSLRGEFAVLQDYMTPIGASAHIATNELITELDSDNNVVYRPKKHTRKVNNFDAWLQAWSLYERLLVSVYGPRVHEYMSEYRSFMHDANRKYTWHALALYDYKHRVRLSNGNTLLERLSFHDPSYDILATVLDATAVRPNAPRCPRCRGYDHTIADCPFPEGPRPQAAARSQIQNEVCQNFNRERCSLGDKCRRKHVCKGCAGKLPYTKCSTSGPCKGQGASSV